MSAQDIPEKAAQGRRPWAERGNGLRTSRTVTDWTEVGTVLLVVLLMVVLSEPERLLHVDLGDDLMVQLALGFHQ